jgi:hypothetical protein
LTACSKSLLSGACGGATEGKCELDREKNCGWETIYNRLKDLKQLDRLMTYLEPKDHRKRMSFGIDMTSPRWDLEITGEG